MSSLDELALPHDLGYLPVLSFGLHADSGCCDEAPAHDRLLGAVLGKMARLPDASSSFVDARLANIVVSTEDRTRFLTVRPEGEVAYPAFEESGAITSMAFVDGYVIIPADVDLVEKDETVRSSLL